MQNVPLAWQERTLLHVLLGKSELCYMCCTEYGASPVCFVGFFGTIFEDLCGAMLQYLINCRDSQENHADEKAEKSSISSPRLRN